MTERNFWNFGKKTLYPSNKYEIWWMEGKKRKSGEWTEQRLQSSCTWEVSDSTSAPWFTFHFDFSLLLLSLSLSLSKFEQWVQKWQEARTQVTQNSLRVCVCVCVYCKLNQTLEDSTEWKEVTSAHIHSYTLYHWMPLAGSEFKRKRERKLLIRESSS